MDERTDRRTGGTRKFFVFVYTPLSPVGGHSYRFRLGTKRARRRDEVHEHWQLDVRGKQGSERDKGNLERGDIGP